MFYALNHRLDDGHLDLSFRDTASWPRVGPAPGMPPSLWLSVGDPLSGPAVQLIATDPVPQDLWIDTHYHGSDQFRAMIQGGMQLQRKALRAPDFGYQIAGVPYREGTLGGVAEVSWMFAVHGDRRGARGTATRKDGTFELGEIGEDQLDRLVDSPDDPYWADVPGGSKGITALATSLERATGGFAWGSFADTERWLQTARGIQFTVGLFGDREAGPIALTLHAPAHSLVLPQIGCATELLLIVVNGTCHSGAQQYAKGDVRIQRASAPLASLVAGADGADLVLLIADRRAFPHVRVDDPVVQALQHTVEILQRDLATAAASAQT